MKAIITIEIMKDLFLKDYYDSDYEGTRKQFILESLREDYGCSIWMAGELFASYKKILFTNTGIKYTNQR